MKEMRAHLELLRVQIADCERLRRGAKSNLKRGVYDRLLVRYRAIATELERAIAALPPTPDIFLGRKTQAVPKRGERNPPVSLPDIIREKSAPGEGKP